jgi:hypothetical protein
MHGDSLCSVLFGRHAADCVTATGTHRFEAMLRSTFSKSKRTIPANESLLHDPNGVLHNTIPICREALVVSVEILIVVVVVVVVVVVGVGGSQDLPEGAAEWLGATQQGRQLVVGIEPPVYWVVLFTRRSAKSASGLGQPKQLFGNTQPAQDLCLPGAVVRSRLQRPSCALERNVGVGS